jgi:hypothetical protein
LTTNMAMDSRVVLETGAAASIFACTFLFGGLLRKLRGRFIEESSIISFAAGMSTAYVFVHLMPELSEVRHAFASSVSRVLPLEGMSIFFVALIGFIAFYGLEHLRVIMERARTSGHTSMAFKLHVGSFSAYVWLTSYLLVDGLTETTSSILLYALAIAFHFLTIDRTMRAEHGDAYKHRGRYWLAAMCGIGWASGLLVPLPRPVLAMLVAFISGAIITNSAIAELPSHGEGRFVSFLIGGILYGLVLLPFS